MTVNLNEVEMLLSVAEEMYYMGYHFAAFPLSEVGDSDTAAFFRNAWDAKQYSYEMTTDKDYYKSVPTASLIGDLKLVVQSGIDLSSSQTVDLTEFLQAQKEREKIVVNNLNINAMNEKNLNYLKDQLKYTGFGEGLNAELQNKMEQGAKEFSLTHEAKFESSSLASELSFKKSDQSDLYFFNSYKAMLSKEGEPHALEQIFYIGKENNFTMKEAFNLLEGRSVNKDLVNKQGEHYNAWVKLDFTDAENNGNFKMTHYHQNYGYNLEAALEKHSIKELETPKFKEDLINSLKKGNIQSVTVVVNGEENKRFVEANPQFKTVKMYDSNLQRINDRESKEEKKSQSESKSASKDLKKGTENENGQDQEEGKKKKQSRRQGASI